MCKDCSDPTESGEKGGGGSTEINFHLCESHIVYICHVPHAIELLLYGPGYVHALLM